MHCENTAETASKKDLWWNHFIATAHTNSSEESTVARETRVFEACDTWDRKLVCVTQKTEQKVYSQGRMLGYLFFSLFSSLFASSYVPWGLPPGKDCKIKW